MHPFRTAVESGDLEAAAGCLSEDVVFNSPVAFQPFIGRSVVREVLAAVFETFSDFEYLDELEGEGTHALIFRARIGEREVQGLDYLRSDAEGLVSEFTVMMRPLSAVVAMAEAMRPKVAGLPKGSVPPPA